MEMNGKAWYWCFIS